MNKVLIAAGRPLSVGDSSIAAKLGGRGRWAALGELDLSAVDGAVRQTIGDMWARDALFEHASVASFSRFSMHLMAVAAPPELVAGAHEAALDEVRHARLCFALASAYKGEPLGPGPLPLEGDILGSLDLASIAVAAVREGCIGETIAALEADAALEKAQLPAPKEALAAIAEDEGKHAELAWRFVKWAIDQGDPVVKESIHRAFRAVVDGPPLPDLPAEEGDEELEHHGRLSKASKRQVYNLGVAEVITPAVRALIGY